jgi:hypothetical protein
MPRWSVTGQATLRALPALPALPVTASTDWLPRVMA